MLIKEGERVPFGYGFVTQRFDYKGVEVQLIPFCWLKRFWLTVFKWGSQDKWEQEKSVAYREGFEAGTNNAYRPENLKKVHELAWSYAFDKIEALKNSSKE